MDLTTGCIPTFNGTAMGNAWAAAVVSNGGAAPAAGITNAVAAFWAGVQQQGLLGVMDAGIALPYAPGDLISATTPLPTTFYKAQNAGACPVLTNTGFGGGDLTVAGLKGDGVGKYLDTRVAGVTIFTQLSAFASCIISASPANEPKVEIGAADATGAYRLFHFNNDLRVTCYDGALDAIGLAALWVGYFSGGRKNIGNRGLWRAKTGIPHELFAVDFTGDGAGVDQPPFNTILFHGSREAGTPAAFSSKRLSWAHIGPGMLASESASLFTLVNAMRTSFGGGNV